MQLWIWKKESRNRVINYSICHSRYYLLDLICWATNDTGSLHCIEYARQTRILTYFMQCRTTASKWQKFDKKILNKTRVWTNWDFWCSEGNVDSFWWLRHWADGRCLINQVKYTSKTWTHLIKEELRKLRLQPGFTKDWEAWKRAIEKSPLNPC